MSHSGREHDVKAEALRVAEIRFHGEQDGPPERVLKENLSALLANVPSVRTAYLARVSYGISMPMSVALCLGTDAGPDANLIGAIGSTFRSVFGKDEHMDIVFLDEAKERQLSAVCVPFLRRRED